MDSTTLRKTFIDFFTTHQHTHVPPASLVPENDPSVLFTTAGMQQFKRYYSDPDLSPHSRVVTIQPCIRTSDIDEVGDSSHLTFFEMLGNFSFGYPQKEGSYFKEETIQLAWEFLTDELKIDKSRIYATYFKGEKGVSEDAESLELLRKVDGLCDIKPQGFDDNFWSLGTEGSPGGPTVEFYVDGLEVWNLVFNEYIIKNGKYVPSEHKGVDTGMGLERLLAILNGKKDIYETDELNLIISKIGEVSEKTYQSFPREFRILADHTRAISHLLTQGVFPSNTGQGYIVRRLIRRSVRRAHELGIYEEALSILSQNYMSAHSDAFSVSRIDGIVACIKTEENLYKKSLDRIALYRDDLIMATQHNVIKKIHGVPILKSSNVASGRYISENYQSFGTPYDKAIEVVRELGLTYDAEEFDVAQKGHKELSRSASAGMFKGGLASGGEMETKYHTATHLLLAALRQSLGAEIYQKGSNITAERLRFDFNYPEKLTDEQIKKVEDLVNQKISENLPVTMTEMPKAEALKTVKVSFDPSKYGDTVKVYTIGNFSSELCGGPHVGNTGVLGTFKIIKEESSSAGVRRIKAVLQ